MHSLRTSRHLVQLLPQPALPEVSSGGARPLARSASTGASPDTLRPCGLHAASRVGTTGLAEQEGHLRSPLSRQCGNPSRSRSRSQTSRSGDRLLQRAAHLESETRTSPACPLRGSSGRIFTDYPPLVKNCYAFFLPVKVLSRIFRGKFVAALKRAFRDGQLQFHGDLAPLAQPKTFSSWL